MRITYNSPVILTFTLICSAVMMADIAYIPGITETFFTIYPNMNPSDPVSTVRMVSHVIGHANWAHLVGNFTFILLLGPMLEEKYGSQTLLLMILVTALVTGLLNITLFHTALMGASGVVFMLILLSSFTNIRSGHIPLTFILVIVLFLGNEVVGALEHDNISQFAHVVGGICGSIFGYLFARPRMRRNANRSYH